MFFIFCFYTFSFNLRKCVYVNYFEIILFSMWHLTLATLCIIGPFLFCHLLYVIIYLVYSNKISKVYLKHSKLLSVSGIVLSQWQLNSVPHCGTWRLVSTLIRGSREGSAVLLLGAFLGTCLQHIFSSLSILFNLQKLKI